MYYCSRHVNTDYCTHTTHHNCSHHTHNHHKCHCWLPHHRPDMGCHYLYETELLSDVSMSRVCYTQVGSCQLQIFTLAAGNSCVCVHFPALPLAFPAGASCIFQPVPVAFSSCQLHSLGTFSPPSCIFFRPQPPYLAPKPFLLSELLQREVPDIFERQCWWKLLPSYLRTNHPSRSCSSAPLVLIQLFVSNSNWSNFEAL